MKLFKLLFTLLILGFIGLFIWENLPAFQTVIPFQLNLHYVQETARWEWTHPVHTLMGIAGGLGFILGMLIMIRPFLKTRRGLVQEREAKRALQASVEVPPQTKSETIPPEVMTSAPVESQGDKPKSE